MLPLPLPPAGRKREEGVRGRSRVAAGDCGGCHGCECMADAGRRKPMWEIERPITGEETGSASIRISTRGRIVWRGLLALSGALSSARRVIFMRGPCAMRSTAERKLLKPAVFVASNFCSAPFLSPSSLRRARGLTK